MREIKFRAWDKWTEKMIYKDVTFELSIDSDGTLNQSTSIAMQYTGLKDRTGKEIYEGDILKEKNDDILDRVYFGAFTVDDYYYYGYYTMTVKVPKKHHDLINKGLIDFVTQTPLIPDFTEVIGNIYENPDLL